MITTPFEINLPGYELRSLREADIDALQRLFEKSADYVWTVEGEEVSPTAAEETFYGGPPGRPMDDKFVFGLLDAQGELAAVMEGFRHYPTEGTWWIGLLMLSPETRGQGIGRKLVDSFSFYMRQQGGKDIKLGVVEDNHAAYAFWQRVGFILESKTEPRPFGKKYQAVYIMRREVIE